MKRAHKISIVYVLITLVVGLVAKNLFSADLTNQMTPPLVRDADLSVSPFKGPEDAPVEIVVFTCFQ
jgi:hypothetical protein